MTEENRKIGLLGKLEPKIPTGLNMLANYLTSPLPDAPETVSVPSVQNWDMLGNDRYGDCTFAGMVHAFMATASEENGTETFPTTDETVAAYLSYTNGQDQGAVESDLLQTWKNTTILGRELLGYAPVPVSNLDEVKQVINTFGVCYIGIRVPASCETQFQKHEPWALTGTPADDQILGGHCIILVGYDTEYFYAVTWGSVQKIEYNWLTQYMDEAWALITPEIGNKGSYNGLNLDQLKKDIEALA
jgi:hypothetical protein